MNMSAVATRPHAHTKLRKGLEARVIDIHGASAECIRLQELGLTVGSTFKVVKVAPFGDPVEIDLRGYRLCLRKNEMSELEIEPVP